MTHDSLSAVKIKQMLYGSHHAAWLGDGEDKSLCLHVSLPTHTVCVQRSKAKWYLFTDTFLSRLSRQATHFHQFSGGRRLPP